jgi:hypothetical protein
MNTRSVIGVGLKMGMQNDKGSDGRYEHTQKRCMWEKGQ